MDAIIIIISRVSLTDVLRDKRESKHVCYFHPETVNQIYKILVI